MQGSYDPGLEMALVLLSATLNGVNVRQKVEKWKLPQEFYHDGNVNISELWKNVNSIPCTIANVDISSYEIVSWILNQVKIYSEVMVKDCKKELSACHAQFEVVSKSIDPSEDEEFERAAKEYGKIRAFHGSAVSNWFSILTNGLRNLSGTKMQKHGNLYGDGIYLSSELQVCQNFAKWEAVPRKTFGTRLKIIGVAEIALHPKYVAMNKTDDEVPQTYYIVSDPRYVRIKGLLLWRQTEKAEKQWNNLSVYLILLYAVILLAMIYCSSGFGFSKSIRATKKVLRLLGLQ